MPGLLDPENWGSKFGSDAPVTTGLLATAPASGLLAPPQAELRSYQPTPREWLHNQFTQFFGGGAHGASAADQAMALIGLTPLEAPLSGYDGGRILGGGLFRSDLGDVARGVAGIGLAGLQAAVPWLLGRANSLAPTAEGPEFQAGRRVFDPPNLVQRPFTADHPSGAPADEQGRITQDANEWPLTAPYIAGRRTIGGPDEAVTSFGAVGKAVTGSRIQVVPRKQMGEELVDTGPVFNKSSFAPACPVTKPRVSSDTKSATQSTIWPAESIHTT